ncbi:MAG: hypothetical protein RJB66_1019 [Pseudomonadota bacterium]|jgi:signal peptidase I
MEDKKNTSQVRRWRDFFEVVIVTFSVAIFLRIFFVGFYRVSTSSMAPSLRIGDFVWVSKASYGIRLPFSPKRIFEKIPEKGDLVLFRYPDQPNTVHIKRVIGLPGDNILIRGQQILVNDRLFSQEVLGAEGFANLPGAEFMRFYNESNGSKLYSVMFTQMPSQLKDVGPLVVPPGEIFVVGDNRDASDDSRYWGSVPLSHIEAKMKGIWFSLNWSQFGRDRKPEIRWDRIGLDF